MKIVRVSAFQIFDSRGNPTIEAEVMLESGACGRGLVPSGASTGWHEARELRDGDPGTFRGRSVQNAVEHVNHEIARELTGRDVGDQSEIDRILTELDGTPDKGRLGANAILAVSMAVANATAAEAGQLLFQSLGKGALLPLPQIQIIGGGAHADHRTDVQDYLIIATGARAYTENLEISFNVYHAVREILKERNKYYGVADEGGFWPEFSTNEEPLPLLVEGIQRAGYEPGKEVAIALDIAASDLYHEATGKYYFARETREFNSEQFLALLMQWCERYPIISLEDPFAQTDWAAWKKIASELGDDVQLVGDDLFCTHRELIRRGIEEGAANAVLIKPNQIGTVTETLAAIELTQGAGWLPIISARSGETEDAFISHLAVATDAGQLKVGSFARGERISKWNEVLRIERTLAGQARFLGARIFDSSLRTRTSAQSRIHLFKS